MVLNGSAFTVVPIPPATLSTGTIRRACGGWPSTTSPTATSRCTVPTARLFLVYNGEIYNYPELRRELEAKGHKFRTHSDGEVICHLYQHHGELLFERLDGMFAAALWIVAERKLILARDLAWGEAALLFESWLPASWGILPRKSLRSSGIPDCRFHWTARRFGTFRPSSGFRSRRQSIARSRRFRAVTSCRSARMAPSCAPTRTVSTGNP